MLIFFFQFSFLWEVLSILKNTINGKNLHNLLYLRYKLLLLKVIIQLYLYNSVIIKNLSKMDKENRAISVNPLSQSRKNNHHCNAREQPKNAKTDPLISVIEDEINNNRECNLLQVLLADPLLKQLNLSLEKEAEQQKKAKLLENFPFRYRNLIHTEMLYKKLQEQMKDKQFEYSAKINDWEKQKGLIQEEVEYLKNEIISKQKERVQSDQQQKILQSNLMAHYQSKLKMKDSEIGELAKTLNQISGKMVKVKKQKQSLIEYLDEIKDEAENLKIQNNRIVQALTEHQIELSKLNKIIAQGNLSLQMTNETLLNKINDMQIEYGNSLRSKQNECLHLIIQLQKSKIKVKEYEAELQKRQRLHEQIEVQKYNEIQQTRLRLLEELKVKNCLEEDMERNREQFLLQIQNLEHRSSELVSQIEDLNNIIIEKHEYHQKQIAKIDQSADIQMKKKIKIIQKQQSDINSLNQQHMKFEQSILQLKREKQSVSIEKGKLQELLKYQKEKFQIYVANSNKRQAKNTEINILANQFKGQLAKFNEIIVEKQSKIQQYRQDILSLRAKNTEINKQRQRIVKQHDQVLQMFQQENYQKNYLHKEILELRAQSSTLSQQLRQNHELSSKDTLESSTQYENFEGVHEEKQLNQRNLQKMTLRYQNVCEQIQQIKKQYKEQIESKQELLNNLQRENMTMKELINNKMFESNDIQHILDSKIKDLKLFYEGKIEEQSSKYKTVISVLRQEMTQLYQELDLKKSIEEQVYQQIIKIKSSRANVIEE